MSTVPCSRRIVSASARQGASRLTSPIGAEALLQGAKPGLVDVDRDDPRAGAEQRAGERFADAARGARQHDRSVLDHHRSFLPAGPRSARGSPFQCRLPSGG
jgi:hypothetical protein